MLNIIKISSSLKSVKAASSTLLALVFACLVNQAQAQTISDLDAAIAQFTSAGNSQGQELDALAHDVQTTARFTGSTFEIYGEGTPVVLDFDAATLGALNFSAPEIQGVKFIRIRLNDSIDFQGELPAGLFNLSQLKYVHILSSVETTATNLSSFIPASGTQSVGFYYSVSIPN